MPTNYSLVACVEDLPPAYPRYHYPDPLLTWVLKNSSNQYPILPTITLFTLFGIIPPSIQTIIPLLLAPQLRQPLLPLCQCRQGDITLHLALSLSIPNSNSIPLFPLHLLSNLPHPHHPNLLHPYLPPHPSHPFFFPALPSLWPGVGTHMGYWLVEHGIGRVG